MKTAVVAMIRHPWKPKTWVGVTRKNDFNDWGLPGGKVEPTEDPVTAIIREVFEETGIRAQSVIHLTSRMVNDYAVLTYIVDGIGHPETQEGEGLCDWKTEDELSAGVFGEYNRQRFKDLEEISG